MSTGGKGGGGKGGSCAKNEVAVCIDPMTFAVLQKAIAGAVPNGAPCTGGATLVCLDRTRAMLLVTQISNALALNGPKKGKGKGGGKGK